MNMYCYERVTLSVVEIDVSELEGNDGTGTFRSAFNPSTQSQNKQ
jgi:hypothetical protein